MIVADRGSGTAVEKMGDDERIDFKAGFEFLERRKQRQIAPERGRSAEGKLCYSKIIHFLKNAQNRSNFLNC